MNRLFAFSTVLVATLATTSLWAASDTGVHDAATLAANRAKAPALISDQELSFLEKWFKKVPESLKAEFQSDKRLSHHLPFGLTDALDDTKPDETIVATVLAELASFRSKDQIEAAFLAAKAKASEERSKDLKERDKRFLALAERTEWATAWLLGKKISSYPTDPESPIAAKEKEVERFNTAFKNAWPEFEKKKLEVLEQIKKAKQSGRTGEEAKAWLFNHLDLRSLPNELASMLGSKEGEKLHDDLLDVMKVGDKFHFSHQAGSTAVTLRAGSTPEQNRNAFQKFTEKMGGANKLSFTSSPNQTVSPDQDWWLSKNGEMVNAAQAKPVENTNAVQSPATFSSNSMAELRNLVNNAKCGSCHNSTAGVLGDSIETARIMVGSNPGRGFTIQEFLSKALAIPRMSTLLTPDLKLQLEQWAKINR